MYQYEDIIVIMIRQHIMVIMFRIMEVMPIVTNIYMQITRK